MRSYSDLPDEIIVGIISRLPAKSVGRCRCVCKSWRALLSQREFIRDHFNRSRNLAEEALIFTSHGRGNFFYTPLKSADQVFDEITGKNLSFAGQPDCWIEVCGSCDGLLLFLCMDRMFILNPLTKEVREVPISPIALNPCECSVLCGFGYDSVNDDYKVVTLSCYISDSNDHTKVFVNVYSLKTCTWNSVDYSVDYDPFWCCHRPCSPGVFVHGSVHWVVYSALDYEPTILAFSMAKEKFYQLPLPSLVGNIPGDLCVRHLLVAIGGHLCTFDPEETNICVMKEYGIKESWTRVTMDGLDDAFELNPLYTVGLGQEEVVLVKNDTELVLCNLKDGTSKNVVVHGIPKYCSLEASFVESLISPLINNETGKSESY